MVKLLPIFFFLLSINQLQLFSSLIWWTQFFFLSLHLKKKIIT